MNRPTLKTSKSFAARCLSVLAGMLIASTGLSAAYAQETGKALKVQPVSGDAQFFMLASEPVITFADSKCKINSNDFSTEYEMADIEYAEIVDHTSGLEDEIKASLSVDLTDPAYAVIRGMNAGSRVTLANLAGIVLANTAADSEGTATVELGQLPAGIYLISSNETNFKIYKK